MCDIPSLVHECKQYFNWFIATYTDCYFQWEIEHSILMCIMEIKTHFDTVMTIVCAIDRSLLVEPEQAPP